MTVHLVRHASAGQRDGFPLDDNARSLDARGRDQAENLAVLLGGDGIERILSSPARRCVETVEPLATKISVQVEADQRLFEGAPIEAAAALLEELAGNEVVLCTHGDLVPELINRLARRGMTITTKKRGSAKGSVWSLEWDGDRFVSGAYRRVPPD